MEDKFNKFNQENYPQIKGQLAEDSEDETPMNSMKPIPEESKRDKPKGVPYTVFNKVVCLQPVSNIQTQES